MLGGQGSGKGLGARRFSRGSHEGLVEDIVVMDRGEQERFRIGEDRRCLPSGHEGGSHLVAYPIGRREVHNIVGRLVGQRGKS